MEPKTIITILCVALFVASIAFIAKKNWSDKEVVFLRNVIHKLNEENIRLNIELDEIYKQRDRYLDSFLDYRRTCKQQSKRIAELIELCDKLQPDLVESKFESLNFIRDCYKKANPEPNDGKVWINETEKVDFKGLVEKLNTYTDKAFYNSQKQK